MKHVQTVNFLQMQPRFQRVSQDEILDERRKHSCLILDQVRRKRVGDVGSLSFEFEFGDCLLKGGVIHPIYA